MIIVEEMLDLPGRPAAPYLATSVQKIEQGTFLICDDYYFSPFINNA